MALNNLISKVLAGGLAAGVFLFWWPAHFPTTGGEWLVRAGPRVGAGLRDPHAQLQPAGEPRDPFDAAPRRRRSGAAGAGPAVGRTAAGQGRRRGAAGLHRPAAPRHDAGSRAQPAVQARAAPCAGGPQGRRPQGRAAEDGRRPPPAVVQTPAPATTTPPPATSAPVAKKQPKATTSKRATKAKSEAKKTAAKTEPKRGPGPGTDREADRSGRDDHAAGSRRGRSAAGERHRDPDDRRAVAPHRRTSLAYESCSCTRDVRWVRRAPGRGRRATPRATATATVAARHTAAITNASW